MSGQQPCQATPSVFLSQTNEGFMLSSPPPARSRLLLIGGLVAIVLAVTLLGIYTTIAPAQDQSQIPELATPPQSAARLSPDAEPPAPPPAKESVPAAVRREDQPADKPSDPAPSEATGEMPAFRETSGGWEMELALERNAKIKHFTLTAPPRLVVDVYGISVSGNPLLTSPTPFISRVRIGKSGDHVRYVLDLTGEKVPAHEVNNEPRRLLITFPR